MLANNASFTNGSSLDYAGDTDVLVGLIFRIISACVSLTACLISILTLTALLRQYCRQGQRRENHSGGDLVMILLEISEVAFCFFATGFFLFDAHMEHEFLKTGKSPQSESLMIIFDTFYYPTSVFMGLRNVWISVMTICRCIAVVKPLWTKIIFTKWRQIRIFIFCVFYSVAAIVFLGVMMRMSAQGQSLSPNETQSAEMAAKFQHLQQVALLTNCFVINLVPMVIIFLTSLIIAVKLTNTSDSSSAMLGNASSKARSNATKITLMIAVSFLCLESFGIVVKTLTVVGTVQITPNTLLLMYKIHDSLMALDSISHFAILYFLSKSFRQSLKSRKSSAAAVPTTNQTPCLNNNLDNGSNHNGSVKSTTSTRSRTKSSKLTRNDSSLKTNRNLLDVLEDDFETENLMMSHTNTPDDRSIVVATATSTV